MAMKKNVTMKKRGTLCVCVCMCAKHFCSFLLCIYSFFSLYMSSNITAWHYMKKKKEKAYIYEEEK